jgi:hypothetical protein
MGTFKNNEYFIEKATKIHNKKYNYFLVDYINSKTKVFITCPIHGNFIQKPNGHLSGKGCPNCSPNKKLIINEFINRCKKTHGNKYDYSLVDYKNSKSKIKIICSIHNVFYQIPSDHINGSGCKKCKFMENANFKKLPQNIFIERSNLVHNNRYDYSLINYINSHIKINIICKEHGIFTQKPCDHLQGNGCPSCYLSKEEKQIEKFLIENNISYTREKKFKECKNIKPLPFDFYLPENKICIEYDGEQHYRPIYYFGGLNGYKKYIFKDKIKNEYCYNNNIKLIRIPYTDFNNIESILKIKL